MVRASSSPSQGRLYRHWQAFLEGPLIERCVAEAIFVRWIGGEQLKLYSTHSNLRGAFDLMISDFVCYQEWSWRISHGLRVYA